jgi:hypothetical protein
MLFLPALYILMINFVNNGSVSAINEHEVQLGIQNLKKGI